MDVLVDSSVWIDYFKGAARSTALDMLIDENLVVTNDLILAELIPFLLLKKQKALVGLLQKIRRLPLGIDWDHIMELQFSCLRHGNNGVGIPDLIIAQNAKANRSLLYSLDKQLLSLANRMKIRTL